MEKFLKAWLEQPNLQTAKKLVAYDDFTRAYMECALWSSNDESTPQGGEPFDANYSIEDIAPETVQSMVDDCARFQTQHSAELRAAYTSEVFIEGNRYNASNAGHDFWLDRNGHGAGFWDRELGDIGEALSQACGWQTEYPQIDLYLGDDGRIYA